MTAVLDQVGGWFRHDLPRLNRLVLNRGAPGRVVAEELARVVLPILPPPDALTSRQAQQLLVGLGLAGASVARHHQEEDPRRRAAPERSFAGLSAGFRNLPFRHYFRELADRTGTGHYHRDSYASLVLWNVPTTEVRWRGRCLAVLPGVFDDDRLHSYTADDGERRFFELIKKGETIELAVNRLLSPMAERKLAFDSPDARRRVRLATTLLDGLRALFVDFATQPADRTMHPHYFMDVFRQFAVHWEVGDIPPSGALDVEALKRDFLLGVPYPDYAAHVRRLMPAMLADERAELAEVLERPSLPVLLLTSVGLTADRLAALGETEAHSLVAAHPQLTDWHLLLSAHARASGAHLMLSKRFLFNPQRKRDAVGAGDGPLVSNRRGTTGMDESFLDRLTRARQEHLLVSLRRTPAVFRAQVLRREQDSPAELTVVVGSGRPEPARAPSGARPIGQRQHHAEPAPATGRPGPEATDD